MAHSVALLTVFFYHKSCLWLICWCKISVDSVVDVIYSCMPTAQNYTIRPVIPLNSYEEQEIKRHPASRKNVAAHKQGAFTT